MTAEHLRPVLGLRMMLHDSGVCARASLVGHPGGNFAGYSHGQITALQKPTGGVRGIVAGDIVRRNWPQQLNVQRPSNTL